MSITCGSALSMAGSGDAWTPMSMVSFQAPHPHPHTSVDSGAQTTDLLLQDLYTPSPVAERPVRPPYTIEILANWLHDLEDDRMGWSSFEEPADAKSEALGLFQRYLQAKGGLASVQHTAFAACVWVFLKVHGKGSLIPDVRVMAFLFGTAPSVLAAAEVDVLVTLQWCVYGALKQAV